MTERNPSADDLGWLPDAPATGFLLDRGQVERVEANPAHARTILAQARMHLSSARILAATEDAAAAFVTAYDAARKSLSAMLAVQGLRTRWRRRAPCAQRAHAGTTPAAQAHPARI